MKLLDLFCGAGGASMGYHKAGFEVTGVDISPQPNYPFEFHQADAMTFPLDGYDAIHASPPCQDHVRSPGNGKKHGTGWMLAATRARFQGQPAPWIIENVPGSPMTPDFVLCGCHFGLPRLKRQRWFETSWHDYEAPPACHHPERSITVTGTGTPTGTWLVYGSLKLADFQKVMDIDWMTRKELSQAIPPAYTHHIGLALLRASTGFLAPNRGILAGMAGG